MDAVHFPEETRNFGAPPGFTKEEVFDLPVCESYYLIRNNRPIACLINCWELSDADWSLWKPEKLSAEAWLLFKPKEPKVYMTITGYSMPPVGLQIDSPFPEGYDKTVGQYLHANGKLPAEQQAELEKMRDQKTKE